jgi:hypothetical protein
MSAKLLGLGFSCDMGTPCRKLVLLKVIDACNDDGSHIFPAVATIARAAQCSTRQVQREMATFVRVGLLGVVREGGKGPGNTREYRMDVDMLRRIEAVGWNAMFGADAGGDKGDRESPLDHGDKGDMGDTERVTPATDKGDKLSHPTPQTTPQKNPQEARGARERGADGEGEGREEDPKRVEAEGWALLKDWPDFGGMPKDAAMRAWKAMSAEDRAEARRKFPHWLALLRAQKKTYTPKPSTYFGERLWRDVPEPEPDAPKVLIAAPFGPVWAGMMVRALLVAPAHPSTWPVASAFQARLLAQDDALGRRARLERQARYGWPSVNAMFEQADRRRGVPMKPEDERLKALVEAVPVGAKVHAAWRAEFERRGWPWLPDHDGMRAVHFPAGGPEGLDAFEAALRQAQGEDRDAADRQHEGQEAAE